MFHNVVHRFLNGAFQAPHQISPLWTIVPRGGVLLRLPFFANGAPCVCPPNCSLTDPDHSRSGGIVGAHIDASMPIPQAIAVLLVVQQSTCFVWVDAQWKRDLKQALKDVFGMLFGTPPGVCGRPLKLTVIGMTECEASTLVRPKGCHALQPTHGGSRRMQPDKRAP